MRALALGLGIVAAVVVAGIRPASAETRFALLIGHNIGQADEVALRWAETDAERMQRLLVEIGNVHPERTVLLKGPARRDVDRAYARLQGAIAEANRRGERTLLLFYYSGHADARALHMGLDPWATEALEADLKASGADTVVAIIDACRNDRTPRARAKGASRAPGFAWPDPPPASPTGFVRVSSAARGEVAQESDDLQGSLFSHHLMSGMRGRADLDRDGVVTLSELYRYGYRRTLVDSHRRASSVQHSELDVALSGSGELILSYPRRSDAQLVFGDDIEGHVLVVDDASGRIVAELEHAEGRTQRLAIASGRYRIQMRGESGVRTGLVAARRGDYEVRASDLNREGGLAVLAKGASFDPYPFVVAGGAGVGRSSVAGFNVAPMGVVGAAWRWSARWRLSLEGFVGVSDAENETWRVRQVEWGAGLGVEWTAWRNSSFDWVLGLRAGLVGVDQAGDRVDAGRLTAADVDDVSLTFDASGVGPEGAAVAGLEYYPSARFGLRLAVVPWVRWLSVDDSTEARMGVTGQLAGVLRL